MNAQMLEVSLLGVGVGTVVRLERNAKSMVKCLRRATNKYDPPSSALRVRRRQFLPGRWKPDVLRPVIA